MRPEIVLRWAAVALGVALLVLLLRHFHALELIARGADAARSAGLLGAVAVGFAVFVGTLLLLPIVPLVVACGWIYGMPGAALSLPAVTLSAVVAFEMGRRFGRTRLQALLSRRPKMRALTDLAERGGIVTVALLRVSPILPFTPSNAVLGMTHLRLRDLVLGTFFGLIPGGLLYTSAGALLPDAAAIARGETPRGPFWAMLALGASAMAIIGIAATRKLRRMRSETGA